MRAKAMTCGAGLALGIAWSTNLDNPNPFIWAGIAIAFVLQGGAVFGWFKD